VLTPEKKKKKVLRATVIGALAMGIAIPMIAAETASAQSGARLCGHYWRSDKTGEVVTRLYEVDKEDSSFECHRARRGGSAKDSPYAGQLKDQDFKNSWKATGSIFYVSGEDWKTRSTGLGGLGNKNLNFIGGGWPKNTDQYDICKDIDRSTSLSYMHSYWLYYNGDPNSTTLDFQEHG
jgi:hypothetical protein